MGECSSCGENVAEYELNYQNGMPVCTSCLTCGSSTNDKPCSRCGVNVPVYELKMHKSRAYCNYCIMDLLGEEEAQDKKLEAPTFPDGLPLEKNASELEEKKNDGGGLLSGGQPGSAGREQGPGATVKLFEKSAQRISSNSQGEQKGGGLLLGFVSRVTSAVALKLMNSTEKGGMQQSPGKELGGHKPNGDPLCIPDGYPISACSGELGQFCQCLEQKKIDQLEAGIALLASVDDDTCKLGKALSRLGAQKQARVLRTLYFANQDDSVLKSEVADKKTLTYAQAAKIITAIKEQE
ncbi:hypothetical protein FJZ26_02645 [Candidatus Parvarchaeota archaeon]|nr:hypothetical protein [Candidatus Parvarchaeota archaeon]